MKTLKLKLVLLAIAGWFVGSAAHAQTFNITYTGNNSDATGQVNVVNGIAVSGFLDVTSGANQGTYNLVSLTSPLINGEPQDGGQEQTLSIPGSDQIFDDVVNPLDNPFLTGAGLEFANNTTSAGFNMWGNGTDSYSLFDSSASTYDVDSGKATIEEAPEPSVWLLMAGGVGVLLFLQSRRGRFLPAGRPWEII